ncbi:helix-turn-helix domain-containing protein [Saccharibacillus sp. CPCC 101409]|uniref:helix-turn-helix domain-containing protein n=1 Tax=Saccharibacillus sp. CPCC 101409 TaxID=3058041 RepID=UPI002672AF09|nr:helix-turn-helix domain-containing protein [Saccharibacillus sp. CPCC 101409]MDO3408215.1 helix-turn-helix domain-containing protein [Saccharibacillus sp. CPCC 101409]
MIRRSRAGDGEALRHAVSLLEPEIAALSRTMRMETNDAAQTLRTKLIELILNESGQTRD